MSWRIWLRICMNVFAMMKRMFNFSWFTVNAIWKCIHHCIVVIRKPEFLSYRAWQNNENVCNFSQFGKVSETNWIQTTWILRVIFAPKIGGCLVPLEEGEFFVYMGLDTRRSIHTHHGLTHDHFHGPNLNSLSSIVEAINLTPSTNWRVFLPPRWQIHVFFSFVAAEITWRLMGAHKPTRQIDVVRAVLKRFYFVRYL